MSDTPNIVGLPQKPDELRAAIEQMKRNAEIFAEMGETLAKIRRAHYLAYKAQGFSEAEALVLCQKATL